MNDQVTWYRADDDGTVRAVRSDRETMWSLPNARQWMANREAAIAYRLSALRHAVIGADNAAEVARQNLRRFEDARATTDEHSRGRA